MSEIQFTTLERELCQKVADLLEICFPDMPVEDRYTAEELENLTELFPEGTIVALDDKNVVGIGTGIFIDIDFDNLPPTENHLLNHENGRSKHNPDGAYYYGSDMAVHPDYRGRGIGREIYNRRKSVIVAYNKIGFAAAAVLPGYAKYKSQIDIHTYLAKVQEGVVFDPTLSMQMRNDFKIIHPIKDFFTYPQSNNWAALILWKNPSFK